ncbi:hypothetical protein [Dactylosporangium salmoneum]|uniref:hypothetical protein n=1 Tax=Dactylosporangium salmoneum TaxID=53361 RepID=UPI0031D0D234
MTGTRASGEHFGVHQYVTVAAEGWNGRLDGPELRFHAKTRVDMCDHAHRAAAGAAGLTVAVFA